MTALPIGYWTIAIVTVIVTIAIVAIILNLFTSNKLEIKYYHTS